MKKRLTFPKKKRKNHSWEQTSKGGDDRSRMGCDPYKEYVFSEKYIRIAARRGKKRALIAEGHSQLISVYLILSTGSHYHEHGAQYMQAKIEQKRKVYLSLELKKLGYQVALTKAPLEAVPN